MHFLLGQVYLGLHQFPQALKEFERLYTLDSQWQIHFLLGLAKTRLGQLEGAEKDLRSELGQHPSSFPGNFVLGSLLSKEGKYEEAVGLLERARSSNPQHSDTLYELARAYWKRGFQGGALKYARAALQADPKNRPAHYLLAQIAQDTGDEETARHEFAVAQSLSESESKHDILRLTELSEASKR